VSCAETAEPFGLLSGGGVGPPGNHVLYGVQVPHGKDNFEGKSGAH